MLPNFRARIREREMASPLKTESPVAPSFWQLESRGKFVKSASLFNIDVDLVLRNVALTAPIATWEVHRPVDDGFSAPGV